MFSVLVATIVPYYHEYGAHVMKYDVLPIDLGIYISGLRFKHHSSEYIYWNLNQARYFKATNYYGNIHAHLSHRYIQTINSGCKCT
jgi:hypothetical protein